MPAIDEAAIQPAQDASPSSQAENRRRQLRHSDPWYLKIALRERDAPARATAEAEILDYSAGGCGLLVNRQVEPGSAVEVLIEIPASGESFILGGLVRWCGEVLNDWQQASPQVTAKPSNSGRFRAGVELSDRTRPDFARWERFVARSVAIVE